MKEIPNGLHPPESDALHCGNSGISPDRTGGRPIMKQLHLEPNLFDGDYAFMFPAGVSTEEREDMLELYRLRERTLEIANKYGMLNK